MAKRYKSYVHNTGTMKARHAGGDYSTAFGPFIEGERLIFGKITIPAGTRAEPHSHPNEQFSYVLQGRVRMTINGKVKTAKAGDIIHTPANAIHSATVLGDEDHIFITTKDASWGIHGIKQGSAKPKATSKKAVKKKTTKKKVAKKTTARKTVKKKAFKKTPKRKIAKKKSR
jgi:quercetin dioxygenase-like cupin family protein